MDFEGMRVYNNGTSVERRVDVERPGGSQDPVETLVSAIRDAARDLVDIGFEVEFEDDPYGGFGTHQLIVSGTPTGELSERAKDAWDREHRQALDSRIAGLEEALRETRRARRI